jgi:hypothetical protein
LPAEDLVFGVDTHMKETDTANFKIIFKIPFVKR